MSRQWTKLKQQVVAERRVWLTSAAVAGMAIGLRLMGVLQSLELAAFDQFVHLRPRQRIDEKIAIVEINEQDLQKVGIWPIPDAVMAELLQKLHSQQPRAIGLDIYRDLPVEPGHAELEQTMNSIDNLIGIEKIASEGYLAVPPPSALSQRHQVGFNNVIFDADGKVRRSLLYWHVNGKARKSFALQLALIYLQKEGITARPASVNPQYLQLGRGLFRPFRSNDGGYMWADSRGYQILADFIGPAGSFGTVSMTDVLSDKVPPDLMRDRIVLIGSTAPSLKDAIATPYSSSMMSESQPLFGVEVQANFISQILNVALTGGRLIHVWPEQIEWLWILCWSWVGTSLSGKFGSPTRLAESLLLSAGILTGSCYLAFLWGWWLPLIPPLLTLNGSAIACVSYLAHQKEELKRSKEFLQQVIDTIPDPIFVKNKNHSWIVLNQAYCQFIGYPLEELINKSDYDVFPEPEADIFWQQDERTFMTNKSQENEEKFTDARGITHLIATKRSLHKDAAGNLFLVGSIRDITERKRTEAALKRVADELARSNAQLKLSKDRFHYQAHHDSLTGLTNRQLFFESLDRSLAWARSNSQILALLFLDLDGFKQINDTLGHDIGDLLLKEVARRLTGCLRGSDTVARLGGDEFTVILPGIKNQSIAAKVAEKILATITQEFELDGHTVRVTASIGISLYPLHAEEMDALVKNADSAMYRAKQLGKNQYQFSRASGAQFTLLDEN